MLKILITGITGFIGSKISEKLCKHGIEVIGLKREISDTWRCADFFDKVSWVNLDIENKWKDIIILEKPDVIIHAAWIGVEVEARDDFTHQSKNINFLVDLLEISKSIKLKKFIFLGSQAEYGVITGRISETAPTEALNAYGATKLAALEILKVFCKKNNIGWIWLRVFSLFGEKESPNWLIPAIIRNLKEVSTMDFTLGEQAYAYLYIEDFSNILYQITIKDIESGIYNISSNEVHKLRTLIEKIRDMVNNKAVLNFGVIPYRENQSMHIEGDISKLIGQIGEIQFTNFNVALQQTINYCNNI